MDSLTEAEHIAVIDRKIQAMREEQERYQAVLDARWRERVAAHFARTAPEPDTPPPALKPTEAV